MSQKLYSIPVKLPCGYHGPKTNHAGEIQTADEGIQKKKNESRQHTISPTRWRGMGNGLP